MDKPHIDIHTAALAPSADTDAGEDFFPGIDDLLYFDIEVLEHVCDVSEQIEKAFVAVQDPRFLALEGQALRDVAHLDARVDEGEPCLQITTSHRALALLNKLNVLLLH